MKLTRRLCENGFCCGHVLCNPRRPSFTTATRLFHSCCDRRGTVLRKPRRPSCTIANRLCDCCGSALCHLHRPSFTLCDCCVDSPGIVTHLCSFNAVPFQVSCVRVLELLLGGVVPSKIKSTERSVILFCGMGWITPTLSLLNRSAIHTAQNSARPATMMMTTTLRGAVCPQALQNCLLLKKRHVSA